jgi:hypothetical protein
MPSLVPNEIGFRPIAKSLPKTLFRVFLTILDKVIKKFFIFRHILFILVGEAGVEPAIPKLVDCGHNALTIKLLPQVSGSRSLQESGCEVTASPGN